uniref:Uncharacterized protein n=1 Tax=Myoviridae sp. ctWb16 TaxID=2827690 RepID=A0A8S5T0N9_9CAUD|nr:MAG TPA: hypothetical protein [Myoviridae sp. ctWb16]
MIIFHKMYSFLTSQFNRDVLLTKIFIDQN